MKFYNVHGTLMSAGLAQEALDNWKKQHGHICNQVADPSTCCPAAHGAPESECNCTSLSRLKSIEVEPTKWGIDQ